MISVGIVGPTGPGPLPHNPTLLTTPYNENKPPRNLQAKLVENKQLEITWEHNCPLIGQYPEVYVIRVTELTHNLTFMDELKSKGVRKLLYIYPGVKRGAVYNVSVASKGEQAKPAVVTVNGPPLPSPRQLKVFLQDNGTYSVNWHEVDEKDQE